MQTFNGHHSWDVPLHLHGTQPVLSSLELAGSNHVDVDWSYCCWSNRPDLQPAGLHLGCHMCCQYSNVPFVDSPAQRQDRYFCHSTITALLLELCKV